MSQGSKAKVSAQPLTLCRLQDIADGGARAVDGVAGGIGQCLIVTRSGQQAHAYVNVCPHMGRRLDWAPGRFLLKDGILVCAVHGASFEADSGLCVGGPCRGQSLRAVPVRVNAAGEVELAS